MKERATKSFPVGRPFPGPSVAATRLEKQREWQTKDLELGTLCPLELIRKRDFEIVMILCLRRAFLPAKEKSASDPGRNEEAEEGGKDRLPRRGHKEGGRGRRDGGKRVGSQDGSPGRGGCGILRRHGRLRRNIPSKTFHSTRE